MLIFIAIAFAGFVIVSGGFFFGHDVDHDADGGADAGHEIGQDATGTISIFSTRVLFTFIMGFGAGGAIARYCDASYPVSSLCGVGTGLLLAAIMYGILLLFVKQQANSIVSADSLVGSTGSVTVPIEKDNVGEVGVAVAGQYLNYTAISHGGNAIAKGRTIKVVGLSGNNLVVEEVA
jgi:membrane-bound ClpP family serine protease